jgi:N-glycosidase YbiA
MKRRLSLNAGTTTSTKLTNEVREEEEEGIIIDNFRGSYYFLSNYYSFYLVIPYEGKNYKSVEHAYQAAKTDDETIREKIMKCTSPGGAKKIGKTIKLSEDWNVKKLQVMEQLVRFKFTNHPLMKEKLLATSKDTLIEGNTWNDTFWGVCKGKGDNNLGKILMKIRTELQNTTL